MQSFSCPPYSYQRFQFYQWSSVRKLKGKKGKKKQKKKKVLQESFGPVLFFLKHYSRLYIFGFLVMKIVSVINLVLSYC